MVSLTYQGAGSGLSILLQHVVDIDANGVFIYQSATEIAGYGDQQTTEYRQIQPLWQNNTGRVWQTQQPVKRSQRQQHYCQDGMTPGRDQPSDLAYQQQIHQACQTCYPASDCTNPGQPKASPGPEHITAVHKGQIGGNQPNQGGHREVNKTWVQRMAKNHNLAGDGLHRHNTSRLKLKINKQKQHQPSLAAVGATGLLLSLTGCSGPFSSLDPKGPAAAEVALLWWGMFGFATLILLLVALLWFYAIKRRGDNSPSVRPNAWLCWGGLALPLLSIMALLLVGIPVGQRMLPLAGDNALKIEVTGHQWYWQVYYPGHAIELTDKLHIPVNTPVYLQLSSADVIHSFWVPRLGVKLDMLPGRTNVLRLEASEAGTYRGQCAEYCGLGHAHMQFSVTAHEPVAFATWLKEHSADD